MGARVICSGRWESSLANAEEQRLVAWIDVWCQARRHPFSSLETFHNYRHRGLAAVICQFRRAARDVAKDHKGTVFVYVRG